MSNNAAAAVACCRYGSNKSNPGYGDSRPVSLRALLNNAPGARQGLLDTVAKALDNAVHGGNSGFMNSGGNDRLTGAGSGGGGNNVVPFPMVNPFRPLVKARIPVPGFNVAPSRHVYSVPPDGSGVPDDEQFSGLGSLGAFEIIGSGPSFDMLREGVSLNSSPTKLQTILGTIQATLPATIQAFRASPTNIYPSSAGYNPYTQQQQYPGYQQGAGVDIGATAGAAAGNVADSFGAIVQRHPYLVLGAGAALLLLFMNPPRRGR